MGNIRMRVNVASYMGGGIYWCGFHHLSETIYLKQFLQPNMVFMDIGANQGEFTLLAARHLTQGKVISFEPVSAYRALLEANVALDQFTNVLVQPFGLSNESLSLPIYTSLAPVHQGSVHDGLSSLYATNERSSLQEMIELRILDELWDTWELDRLDFIKIDIEGAELFALKGGRKVLEKYRPDILIEVSEHTYNAGGYQVADMLAFLLQMHYVAHRIVRGVAVVVATGDPMNAGDYLFRVPK